MASEGDGDQQAMWAGARAEATNPTPARPQEEREPRLKRVNHQQLLLRTVDVEADRFLEDFRERLGKFGLEPRLDKTRRIEFGRYAEPRQEERGEGEPETFDFLGFTHISGTTRKGYFTVKRRTSGKRMRAKLQQIKQQLRSRMHHPVAQTGKRLKSDVQGYFNYHAVPGNIDNLGVFGKG